jgi:hypothetical protein
MNKIAHQEINNTTAAAIPIKVKTNTCGIIIRNLKKVVNLESRDE